MPNERYSKTGRHFFNQPKLEKKLEINEKLKEMKNQQEINKPITLSQIIGKIKKNSMDQGFDLMKILEDHDKAKTGKKIKKYGILLMNIVKG